MKKHMKEQNRLWDYEVLKELGRGQYGQVFQVKSKKDNQIYAIKKINLANAHQKEKVQAYRQIKALKLIHHPSIIQYYESFLSMDNIYIVTQFADKGDLMREIKKRIAKEKKFTQEQLWDIFIVLIQGLKHIHEKNIVHRDIKIQNIFQTQNGVYKIGDLGMSKIMYQSNDMISTRVGTPIYFAPQIIQHRLYSYPVDIWALGCSFYYMAALEHPFKDATIQTLGFYMVDREAKPIKGSYSPQLISFITSMLDKNPQTRPSVHDLYKKLKERKQTKIHNKISIFNIKQIMHLRASRDKLSSQKQPSQNKDSKKQQQAESPTLLYHRNRSRINPQSENKKQLMNSQSRNLSLFLPKNNKIKANQPNSPLIKSNGFTTHLITSRNEQNSVRYGESSSISPRKTYNAFKEVLPSKARARKSFEFSLHQ